MLWNARRWRTLVAGAVAALALLAATTALAAHPKAGKKYKGTTSALKFNGFKSPVSFKVSSDGTKLLGFKYSSIGCGGIGGQFKPGVNYLLKPGFVHKVGTIPVSSKGKFSVNNAKSTYKIKVNGKTFTTVTTSSVRGKFKTSKKATGTITFSQAYGAGQTCGPVSVTFTAKLK